MARLFGTSIRFFGTPSVVKHSTMASTCSPCTMICFNLGLRGSGCTAAEDAHVFLSPLAKLSVRRSKFSRPDMYVIVWLWRRTTLIEIGFGVPSLGDFE